MVEPGATVITSAPAVAEAWVLAMAVMSLTTQEEMAVKVSTELVAKVPTSTSVTTATGEILAKVLSPVEALVESRPTKSFSAAAVVEAAVATPSLPVLQLLLVLMAAQAAVVVVLVMLLRLAGISTPA